MLIPVFMSGLIGAFIGFLSSDPLSGFLWGMGVGLVGTVAILVGMFGWEWLENEMEKGKLFPYLIMGLIGAIAISGYFGLTLGDPSCDEYNNEPQGSCVQYADDGYEVTTKQRWEKFWGTFPVTLIITSLVATLVHHNIHKKK